MAMILVVEDEPAQAEVLRYNFEAEGFEVRTAGDGEEALLMARELEPGLIVLDWMLPAVSGIEVCRRLKVQRETRNIPVIMLTARGEEADLVRGLETGADDYVVKPYSLAELLARVRSHLRRYNAASTGTTLVHDGIELDTETYRVSRDGQTLKLGPTEFRLLSTLLERPGKVWTREQLLDRVWGRDVYVDDRTVDVHIGRLRKSINLPGAPDVIRTVRGAGYALGT